MFKGERIKMRRTELDTAWAAWKRTDPRAYDRFRKEFSLDKLGSVDKDAPEGFSCDLWKDFDNHHLCDLCKIESCHVNRKYSADRWTDDPL